MLWRQSYATPAGIVGVALGFALVLLKDATRFETVAQAPVPTGALLVPVAEAETDMVTLGVEVGDG